MYAITYLLVKKSFVHGNIRNCPENDTLILSKYSLFFDSFPFFECSLTQGMFLSIISLHVSLEICTVMQHEAPLFVRTHKFTVTSLTELYSACARAIWLSATMIHHRNSTEESQEN